MKICPKCGEKNNKEARFCTKCGYNFGTGSGSAQNKSKK
ncbi:zinc-ribbon domain-containing protein [Limosilactobacillus sp. STM2_1]|uniref:Zinc-ribbon domain-containing protein n=1 Tax=Limosilactobacillus rudii TaxID=2759755 RepID=A0A7W3YN28_9LACO|nr:zinc-ribbon domain-containing protein [Limosilactobacillus rudii]MBB1097668.1 zinc-ribbon domain-containing protein [Limosilactobacillus rudii]